MNTRDFLLVGAGVVVGFFAKRTLDNKNALDLANRVDSLPDDTNYVFSQKYKDCEAQADKTMGKIEFAVGTDLVGYKKQLIDACMKDTGIR